MTDEVIPDNIPTDPTPTGEIPDSIPTDVAPGEEIPDNIATDNPYASSNQQAITAAEGAAQGFLGPLGFAVPEAEAALNKIAPQTAASLSLTPQDMAAREAENPAIHTIAQTAGLVGSTAFGPLGAVSKGIGLIGPASKIGSAALQGFIGSGLIQASDEKSKSILGQSDPNAAVSSALANTSASALLGGTIGGIFGAGSSALSAAAERKIGTNISSWLTGLGAASKGVDAEDIPASEELNQQMLANGHAFYTQGINDLTQSIAKSGADLAGAGIGNTLGGAPGAYIGYKIADKLAPTIAKIAAKPVTAVSQTAVPAALKFLASSPEGDNLAGRFYNMLDYGNAIDSGAQKINSAINNLFQSGGQQAFSNIRRIDQQQQQALKDHISQGGIYLNLEQSGQTAPLQNYAEGGEVKTMEMPKEKDVAPFSKGSVADTLPAHDALINAAKGRITNYLSSLQPPKNSPKLAFDDEPDTSKQEKSYDRALDIANRPLSILDHIKAGTIEPEHIKHFNNLYPELNQHLQQKITERIIQAQLADEKPSYPVRMGLSMMMQTPLDGTLIPQNIQAAQSVFVPTTPAQPPNGPGTTKNRKNTSTLSKASSQYLTSTQAAAMGQQTRD